MVKTDPVQELTSTDQQLIETISEQIESARKRRIEFSPEIESKSKKKLGDLKIRKANAEQFVWVYRYYSQKKLGLPSVPQREMQNLLKKEFPGVSSPTRGCLVISIISCHSTVL